MLPDGSFRAEDVLPGKYDLGFQSDLGAENNTTTTVFGSPRELIVPEAKDKNDDSPVDWGDVELKKYGSQTTQAPIGVK